MGCMKHATRVLFFLLIMTITALAEHKSAALQFMVIKDENGKPVKNAEIVLHPVDSKGRQHQDGIESKTHEDGKAEIRSVPYGKVRIQIIAAGFQTFGGDYEIGQP